MTMSEEKSVSISFRVTPRFKRLLQAAAEQEHRSQTNLLETLLFAHCVKHGVEESDASPQRPNNRGDKK